MVQTRIITPKVANGFVSRQFNLGVDNYDLDELYSPDTDQWKSKVLHLGSAKYPPQVAANPTRYWFDRSRYNNHGTITGATWEQLPSGVWAMNFDGIDDQILCGNASSLQLSTDFTLLVWFKTTQNQASYAMFACKQYAYALAIHTRKLATYDWAAAATRLNGVIEVNDDKFHLGTFRNLASTGQFFLDGVVEGASFAYSASNQTDPLYVGATGPAIEPLAGTIGDCLIYNRPLTPLEIQQIYLVTKWRYV